MKAEKLLLKAERLAVTDKIAIFIPMYNCSKQVVRVLSKIDKNPIVQEYVSEIICVDNRSEDDTYQVVSAYLDKMTFPSGSIIKNAENYGLGGSHKVALTHARETGIDYLIILHGDDQGSIDDLKDVLVSGQYKRSDFCMGARFMPGSKLVGYSLVRTLANRAFNILFSIISGTRLFDLGSGLNMVKVGAIDFDSLYKFSDDLTFNYYLILWIAKTKSSLHFFPLTWVEEDQVSNARLKKMGLQLLNIVFQRSFNTTRFFESDHRDTKREAYPTESITTFSSDTR